MNWYEVPLSSQPETFSISINGAQYTLTFTYRSVTEGGWFIDIADGNGKAILNGLPLVTGTELLGQYAYLGIGGSLYVFSDSDPLAEPTADNLGTTSHLYYAK